MSDSRDLREKKVRNPFPHILLLIQAESGLVVTCVAKSLYSQTDIWRHFRCHN